MLKKLPLHTFDTLLIRPNPFPNPNLPRLHQPHPHHPPIQPPPTPPIRCRTHLTLCHRGPFGTREEPLLKARGVDPAVVAVARLAEWVEYGRGVGVGVVADGTARGRTVYRGGGGLRVRHFLSWRFVRPNSVMNKYKYI